MVDEPIGKVVGVVGNVNKLIKNQGGKMAKRVEEIEYGVISAADKCASLICSIERLSRGFDFDFLAQFSVAELEAYKKRLEIVSEVSRR